MTAPELKPCPCCGGKPYLANVEMAGCAYVVCTDCRMQSDDGSQDRVIAAWNTRAPDPDLDAHIGAVLEMICSTQVRSTSDDQVTHEIPPILKAAIRALRPDALQALERVRREARVEGMREKAEVACQIEADRGQRMGEMMYHHGAVACRNAIRAALEGKANG